LGSCERQETALPCQFSSLSTVLAIFPCVVGDEQVHPIVATICSSLVAPVVASVRAACFPRDATQRLPPHVPKPTEQIMDESNNQAPSLETFGSTDLWLIPQQTLFVETIAMLLTETMDGGKSHLSHICLLVPNPDEPTHLGITLLVAREGTHYANDRQWQPLGVFEVQLLPPRNLDRQCLWTLPVPVWIGMGRLIVVLQLVSMLSWCSSLTRRCGSTTIKTAIAFETDQGFLDWQFTALAPQSGRIVPTIHEGDDVLRQMRPHLRQLGKCHLGRRRLYPYPLLVQNVRPTAGGCWQYHQYRKLPSKRHRFLVLPKIVDELGAPICRGNRFGRAMTVVSMAIFTNSPSLVTGR
jgi:hypothetical protein